MSVTPCKAQVGASCIFRLLKKKEKKYGFENMGAGEEDENMHFFQAFYSLNMLISSCFFFVV